MNYMGITQRSFLLALLLGSRYAAGTNQPQQIQPNGSAVSPLGMMANSNFLSGLGTLPGSSNDLALYDELLKLKRERDNLPIQLRMRSAVTNGVEKGIEQLLVRMTLDCLSPLVTVVKYPIEMLTKWVQCIFLGRQQFAWNYLAVLNNNVYDLIYPLSVPNLGDFSRERRVELPVVPGGKPQADTDWEQKRLTSMQELTHIVAVLKEHIQCYGPARPDAPTSRVMNRIINAFSLQQRQEISRSIQFAILYIEMLIQVLNEVSTAKGIDTRRDHIKWLLTRACRAFKRAATFINEDVAANPHQYPQYIKFQEPTLQGQSSLAGLDSLFANPTAPTA